ncbi:MAG: hypothetical protein ACXABY_31950 [Candidatus Thorarchaeota archaeon]|jgi:hypothetical protein
MDKMKWTNPKLVAIDEEDMQELMLAISYEREWAKVGGFHNFVVECAARHGGVARVIDLGSEVAEVGK